MLRDIFSIMLIKRQLLQLLQPYTREMQHYKEMYKSYFCSFCYGAS